MARNFLLQYHAEERFLDAEWVDAQEEWIFWFK